jgi:hypothetical protein
MGPGEGGISRWGYLVVFLWFSYGRHRKSYGKLPFTVSLPIEHGDLAIGNGDSIGKVATTMGFNGISPTTMGISWRL